MTKKECHETRVGNRDKFEKQLRDYESFANSIYLEATKVLITLNTALLAFSSPILSARLLGENESLKTLIIIVWFLLGASIVSGIVQLLADHYYFSKTSEFYSRLFTIWNDAEENDSGIAKAVHETDLETQRSFCYQSNPIPFVLEITFFIFALILLIYIFSKTI